MSHAGIGKKIIVLGSLNIDLTIRCDRIPENGETLHGNGFSIHEGGKGGNQATSAAKQGSEVIFLGALGRDQFGNRLKNTLEEYGVDTRYLQYPEDTVTGVATIIITKGDNRIILDAGANFAIDNDLVGKNLEDIGNPEDIFITQFEIDDKCTLKGLQKAKELGMLTILNPAPARSCRDDIYQYTDIIIVNQSECEIISGIYPINPDDCKQAIRKILQKGVKRCIITLGTSGSYTMQEDLMIYVPSLKVSSIDTTAAGDSYIGALAARLLKGDSLEDGMRYATKVAAITVTRPGAQSAIPYARDVNSFNESDFHQPFPFSPKPNNRMEV